MAASLGQQTSAMSSIPQTSDQCLEFFNAQVSLGKFPVPVDLTVEEAVRRVLEKKPDEIKSLGLFRKIAELTDSINKGGVLDTCYNPICNRLFLFLFANNEQNARLSWIRANVLPLD